MMRLFKVTLITLVLCLTSILSLSCASESESAASSENQVVTVERGNLIIDITAVGNLALSRTEDLAFDIFYLEATVEEVLVEEGDTVKEGQELAKLDISEWEDQLEALEDKVRAAERQLTAEKRDLLQAEINLINAGIALEDAEAYYVWPEEIFAAREAVRQAESELEEAQGVLGGGVLREVYDRKTGEYYSYYEEAITPWDIEVWTEKLADAEDKLSAAQVTLDELLAASAGDTEEVAIKRLEVELKQGKLEDAQIAIEDAQEAVEDAQEDLEEAESKSPIVTALFDGFITSVKVEGGDEVLNGTVAVQLADPNKFEADVMVSEMDILQVRLGGGATVQVDAMPSLTLPAKVTHISPTATIQSGVVNYKVKVELESLTPLEPSAVSGKQEQSQTGLEAFNHRLDEAVEVGLLSQERADEIKERVEQGVGLEDSYQRLDEALEAGTITQEQAEQIRERLDQWKAALEQQPEPMPTQVPDEFQLREGLTVTVSILVQERNNVLLVPNKAITRQGQETYVQVMEDGVIEECSIKTGISDWQYTEVIDGLTEGEEVVIPQATTSEASTERRQGGMFR